MNLRRLRAPVLALVLLATQPLVPDAAALSVAPGEILPPFTLPDPSGSATSLESFRGRPVVVAFFSTWCSRCAEELAFLRDRLGGRSDVAVLLVNQDGEQGATARNLAAFRDRLSLPFPILLDEGLSLWGRLGISALPTTLVVGSDGRLLHAEAGFAGGAGGRLLSVLGEGAAVGETDGHRAGNNAAAGEIARGGAAGAGATLR